MFLTNLFGKKVGADDPASRSQCEAVTPSGVTEDIVLQKMQLPKASVVSPNQKQTYISTPYSKINRKL